MSGAAATIVGKQEGQQELVRDLLALKRGEHLCLIYDDDPREQMPALLSFISQGLENGEQCIYVADDQSVDQAAQALADHGIDVPVASATGALRLWTRSEWRQPGGIDSARKKKAKMIYLHAQIPVIGFYEKMGFHCVGRVFKEAGIPHRKMVFSHIANRSFGTHQPAARPGQPRGRDHRPRKRATAKSIRHV